MIRYAQAGHIEREPEYSFINNIWGPIELELKLT